MIVDDSMHGAGEISAHQADQDKRSGIAINPPDWKDWLMGPPNEAHTLMTVSDRRVGAEPEDS